MKKAICVMFAIMTALLLTLSAAAMSDERVATSVSISPTHSTITPGQTLEYVVYLDGISSFNAAVRHNGGDNLTIRGTRVTVSENAMLGTYAVWAESGGARSGYATLQVIGDDWVDATPQPEVEEESYLAPVLFFGGCTALLVLHLIRKIYLGKKKRLYYDEGAQEASFLKRYCGNFISAIAICSGAAVFAVLVYGFLLSGGFATPLFPISMYIRAAVVIAATGVVTTAIFTTEGSDVGKMKPIWTDNACSFFAEVGNTSVHKIFIQATDGRLEWMTIEELRERAKSEGWQFELHHATVVNSEISALDTTEEEKYSFKPTAPVLMAKREYSGKEEHFIAYRGGIYQVK